MKFYIYSNKLGRSMLYRYAQFIFNKLKNDIRRSSNIKLSIRYEYIFDKFIKWKDVKKRPPRIDLKEMIISSLELSSYKEGYCISINNTKYIPNSSTKLGTITRLIEYGNNRLRPYPLLHRLFRSYRERFNNSLFEEFVKRGFK